MHCKTIRNQLIHYVEGNLATSARHATSDHLSGCSECNQYFHLLQELFSSIENEKVAAYDPYMLTRVMAAVENKKQSRLKHFLQRSLQPIIITLVMALIILAGINLGKIYGYQQTIADDYKSELYYLGTMNDESFETILLSE